MTKKSRTEKSTREPESSCEMVLAIQDLIRQLEKVPADEVVKSVEIQSGHHRYVTEGELSAGKVLAKLRHIEQAYLTCECRACRLGRRQMRAVRRAQRHTL